MDCLEICIGAERHNSLYVTLLKPFMGVIKIFCCNYALHDIINFPNSLVARARGSDASEAVDDPAL